ncbi:ATP-grasp domain-containing protein [Nocardioides piscis]|uniref:ATP-grasp domain-containing protein n=1 Tax=Nocardioides piscis TaxID=2714938 RepID=A0A6G7YEA1_9ACTN|nr:ATP-grasp domain-containing protein [Nocardioides piscis]QIK75234.1 ATP-grasp domain-containing protein [Nocardioides piscis]
MRDPVNFLVTSAGRRGELVKILREVVELNGQGGGVFTVDRSALTAAGWLSDGLDLVPPIADQGYVDALLQVCERRQITDLIPTIDTELPVLSEHRQRFAELGTTVWVSDQSTIRTAQDKRLTNEWLGKHDLPRVQQWDLAELDRGGDFRFPLIAKPARGSSSIGLRRITSLEELTGVDESLDYVIEEVASGEEYTVDLLVDRHGRCRSAVPRRRLETRAGEVSKGLTVRDSGLVDLATRVSNALPGAFGVLNVQIFLADDGDMRVIEVNARFGGGYPLSWAAGAQFPLWLVQERSGRTPTASLEWMDQYLMLRYDTAVFMRGLP